jgi:hypothetical protein
MKTLYICLALATGALGSATNAADSTIVRRGELGRPIVRLANQELGYSVLHDTGPSSRGYRVHLTCTLDGSFSQTYCPTVRYFASCPRAQIACQ